ncbi:cytochrome c oxidase subunit 3 [Flavobacterium davisii]|uniref:Cytochrome c oxidase subunit 3 n=1 Tax=Flavobacterium columnare TaxID=996 RepID=A0A8G0KRY2_9FLAO|nr:cytochrome c oxidase subunit 3 [Flavobacterium davisii]QYS88971.1 cytochrome c oxidase subunit 3 [Flavobacterium davisii]
MKESKTDYTNFYYPPGGILLWIIIILEILTFGIAIIAMNYSAQEEIEIFSESRLKLNNQIGLINTVILLTSGFFMAEVVNQAQKNNNKKFSLYLKITLLLGFLFLILKSYEYFEKLNDNISLDTNLFFTYYGLLTGFHFLHVLIGLFILLGIYAKRNKIPLNQNLFDIEASATFWHMCDLIWLIVFPTLYLIF